MVLKHFWFAVTVMLVLACKTVDLENRSPSELYKMKIKYDECCRTNVCLRGSCYSWEWRAASWSVMRERCQSFREVDWNYDIDIFTVKEPEDIIILWNLLSRASGLRNYSEPVPPRTVWTSGTRCPKWRETGIIVSNRWTHDGRVFPEWLEERINGSIITQDENNEECKFLVITPSANPPEVKYEFQDEFTQHAAVCEYLFPGDIHFVTPPSTTEVITTPSTTESTTEPTTSTTEPTTSTTETTTSTMEPTTSTTEPTTSTTEPTTSTTPSTTSTISTTPSSTVWTTMDLETSSSTTTEEATMTTRLPTGMCQERSCYGIDWPETPIGTVANVSCPKDMLGYAQWTCDETTLQFVPDKPFIQDCKHAWIGELEKDIEAGKDAVCISASLANKTKLETMSHGDITAIVTVAEDLISLFIKQKDSGKEEILVNRPSGEASAEFSKSMVAAVSNVLSEEIKDAWNDLPMVHQRREASRILKLVSSVGKRLSCLKKTEEYLQFTIEAENINMQTFILTAMVQKKSDYISFPHIDSSMRRDSVIFLPANLKMKNFISPCSNFSTAVGVVYKHVGDFLQDDSLYNSTTRVITTVLSFSMGNFTESVSLEDGEEAALIFRHIIELNSQELVKENPRCVFWNFSKGVYGQWDDSGCRVTDNNSTHTECACNHLTNFAVLMDINNVTDAGDFAQNLMTVVCCGVSCVTLLLTLACFYIIRNLHGKRTIITANLCFCLLTMNMLVIFGLDQTDSKVVCGLVAGFLHFFSLASFFWMLMEGWHLYQMVVIVFHHTEISVKYYYAISYGFPFIIVSVSAALRTEDYGGKYYCWLTNTHGLMWSFVGPECLIMGVNLVVFILTLRSASNVRIKHDQSFAKKIRAWVGGSMSVLCLLGLTWCLGLFFVDKRLFAFSYIFIAFNGLQGVLIFLFHIILNEKAVAFFCGPNSFLSKRKDLRQRKSKNRIHSKCSSQTSVNSAFTSPYNQSIEHPTLVNRNTLCEITPQHVTSNKTSTSKERLEKNRKCSTRSSSAICRKITTVYTRSENGRSQDLSKSTHFQKARSKSIPERSENITNNGNNHCFQCELS